MITSTPSPADHHLQVIADHIRSSAGCRDRLASTLRGPHPGRHGRGQGERSLAVPRQPVSAFDEVIAAIARPPDELSSGVQPPPERFMVRVATVGAPARPTKRNYNYFEALDAALAEQLRDDRPLLAQG